MSKLIKRIVFAAALVGSAFANAQDPITDLLDELAQYENGDVRIPLREAHLWVTNALNSEADSAAVASLLASLLDSDATLDCKQFVCRELARIGNADQVPALANMLNDEQTADMARIALQAIPGPEADAALIAALDSTSGDVRIGVINSLGERHPEAAVSALRKVAKKGSDAEAQAAAAALGKYGTGSALRALRSAKRGASPDLRAAVEDALLVCNQLREADQP